ncbi:MAG: glycosyltransferase [Atopobiaceae bacterium]|nr:glycosyltransferase [Atopobiaceae bacterium]MBR1829712.1 glycosyltransferase [Atopobiaceae bacterium]
MTTDRTCDLSIIVPCYNTERYLGEALASLERLKVSALEVLLINDGSTDGSMALMADAARRDGRFRVIDKANEGYGATVNRGIDEAHGSYVGILEPDDFFYDGAVERLLDVALTTGADVVKGDFTFYWSKDGGRDVPAGVISSDMVDRPVDTRVDTRIFRAKASIWSALYRRAFLNECGIRCQTTQGASFQDTSFSFKVYASASQVRFVDVPVVHYRQDNEASSINSKDKANAVVHEFDVIDAWLDECSDSDHRDALRLEAQVGRFNAYLWNLDRLGDETALPFLEDMAAWYVRAEKDGSLDLSRWDGWRLANLRSIERSPMRYLALRRRFRGDSSLSKALFALALGGPSTLLAALSERAGRS